MLQSRFIILIFVLSLVITFAFGPLVGMKMDNNGEMEGCPFAMSAICPMGVFEHIGNWQSLFMVILQEISTLSLLITFTLILLIRHKTLYKLPDTATQTQSHYLYQNPEVPIFHYLEEMFSQGILNPRIYA